MAIFEKIKSNIIRKSRFQDVIFISGIFAFAIIIVLGLFPKTDPDEGATTISFVYLMMVIPIIVAIYFIIISFKRKLYSETSEISSSITFKIGLAFVFVAIISSVPILIISNSIIHQTIDQLITEESVNSLEESVKMSYDTIRESHGIIEDELKSLHYSIKNNTFEIDRVSSREYMTKMYKIKGLHTIFYQIQKKDGFHNDILLLDEGSYNINHFKKITKYLKNTNLKEGYRTNNISIKNTSIILGNLTHENYVCVLYKEIPATIYKRIALYNDTLKIYKERSFLKPYFEMGIGIVLLTIAIIIIVVAISLGFFLSRNITRPILEMVDAAGDVASGNFNINLNRDSSDELALLFNSFNQMVFQLNESKRMMFQTQKLEAWREVARKLIHEIKNPLTPIKLSAERIRKKFQENQKDIESAVITGTDTIIEEVKVLTLMLNEFSQFARLPEMKGELEDINPIVKNSVNSFIGYENVNFHLDLVKSPPKIFVDKILMRQALTNLLQNAVEANSGKGNIYISTEIIDDKYKNMVRLIIKDDGAGIDEKDLGKIFDPTFSKKEGGTGIGLAIVNKIIIEHNGKIVCNSIKNEWTEFVIDFPINEQEVVAIGKDTSS